MTEVEIKSWEIGKIKHKIVAYVGQYTPFYITFKKVIEDETGVKQGKIDFIEDLPKEVFEMGKVFEKVVGDNNVAK